MTESLTEAEDALFIQHDTSVDEIADFVEGRVTDPHVDSDGNIVWNFSTYPINHDGLHLDEKNCDEFLIPYQPTGAWAVMFTMLPERIRKAEVLVWRAEGHNVEEGGEYFAYRQFYRDLPNERRKQVKNDLARKVHEELQ